MKYCIETLVTFENPSHPPIVMEAISVEGEMKPDVVDRQLSLLTPTQLSIRLSSDDVKRLRMSSSSFMELLHLSVKTIEELSM